MTTDTTLSLDAAIAAMMEAGQALGEAKVYTLRLEDARAIVKRDAIRRLVDSGVASSATAAEKVVESDPEYAAHRERQFTAVMEEQAAWAYWEAARARVWSLAKGAD